MESSDGVLVDPSKFGKMSLDEKRDFVYQLSKWSHGASDILQLWSRQEILQILCAEMGKERKYTGLTKLKMIEHLLKIVSGKNSEESDATRDPDQHSEQRFSKRQRKAENPSHVSVPTTSSVPVNAGAYDLENSIYCKNTACKANLSKEDAFCKRCSCCICHKYDDNKDPSLWLTCSSEPPFEGNSCGMSCHLECALKNVKSCIANEEDRARNDGCFCCVSCQKINDMLRCWRKQLLMSKETRRVDILCYRLALTKKLMKGTEKYSMLYEIVENAVKMLESEVGPLSVIPVKMGRGIVNRLSSGQPTQKLCSSALEMLDSMISTSSAAPPVISTAQDSALISQNMVRFDDVNPTSLRMNLGSINPPSGSSFRYSLWHRRSDEADYASEPTSTLSHPHSRFVFLSLTPSTEYFFKIVCFDGSRELARFEVRSSTSFLVDEGSNEERSQSPVVTNSSSLSNPSSVEDETNNLDTRMEKLAEQETLTRPVTLSCPNPETNTPDDQVNEDTSMDDGSGKECVPFAGATQPITPCKLENGLMRASNRPGQDGSSSKKGIDDLAGNSDRDFEFYVKLIRWLECKGHIEKNFRQKFLTWYSLRATQQEVRIVKVFVDTFLEDPASLSEQLIDTFSDKISNNTLSSTSVGPPGMCMKLWHR